MLTLQCGKDIGTSVAPVRFLIYDTAKHIMEACNGLCFTVANFENHYEWTFGNIHYKLDKIEKREKNCTYILECILSIRQFVTVKWICSYKRFRHNNTIHLCNSNFIYSLQNKITKYENKSLYCSKG